MHSGFSSPDSTNYHLSPYTTPILGNREGAQQSQVENRHRDVKWSVRTRVRTSSDAKAGIWEDRRSSRGYCLVRGDRPIAMSTPIHRYVGAPGELFMSGTHILGGTSTGTRFQQSASW